MLAEQTAQLTAAHAQPAGQRVEIGIVESAHLDQSQRARYRVGRAAPRAEIGRRFRPAAQAGAKAGLLRRGGRGKESHVLGTRDARRTDRPTIDAGRLDAGEEPSVEARVALTERAITGIVIKVHLAIVASGPSSV